MLRLALAMLHDDDLARDAVHDVFARLLERDPDVEPTASYLLRAVRNRCLNHIRDCEIHRRVESLYLLDNTDYAADWPDPDDLARVDAVVARDLTPQARRVVELRFRSGMPFAEVAEEMGISQTAVFRHLRHALSIIRQKITPNG